MSLSSYSYENPGFDTPVKVSPSFYVQLAQDLIRYVRGEQNQRQLSTLLGFSFNQVGKWESGVTQIKWKQFLKICQVQNIPILKSLEIIFLPSGKKLEDGTLALEIIEQSLQISLSRTQNKKIIDPDLAEVLKAIDTKSKLLINWLSTFVDCTKFELLKAPFEQFQLALESIANNPLAVFVQSTLELDNYQALPEHDDSFIAHHATTTPAEVRRLLQELSELKTIFFDGKKYHLNKDHFFNFSFVAHPKLRSLTKYVTDLVSQRYSLIPVSYVENKFNPSRSSAWVNAMSHQTAMKISDLMVEFHNKVAELIKNDTGPKNNVQVIVSHSFSSTINKPSDH